MICFNPKVRQDFNMDNPVRSATIHSTSPELRSSSAPVFASFGGIFRDVNKMSFRVSNYKIKQ